MAAHRLWLRPARRGHLRRAVGMGRRPADHLILRVLAGRACHYRRGEYARTERTATRNLARRLKSGNSKMKIHIIGGGPAALYFAILMKRLDPSHQITIAERDGPNDTF